MAIPGKWDFEEIDPSGPEITFVLISPQGDTVRLSLAVTPPLPPTPPKKEKKKWRQRW